MQTHTNGLTDVEDEYFDIEHVDPVDMQKQNNIKEVKSKRLNLLIKPSVHANIKKIATMKQISVNHLVNELLKDVAETEAKLIDKYNDTFHTD